MEVFAVFGGRLSLFNTELNQGVSTSHDYVTLSKVFNPVDDTIEVAKGQFILYEARLDGIVGIFPYKAITIIETDGTKYRTALYRVLMDDSKNGFLVLKDLKEKKLTYKDKISVSPTSLNDYDTIVDIVGREQSKIEEINCSSSRFDCPPTGFF